MTIFGFSLAARVALVNMGIVKFTQEKFIISSSQY